MGFLKVIFDHSNHYLLFELFHVLHFQFEHQYHEIVVCHLNLNKIHLIKIIFENKVLIPVFVFCNCV
jgi:hypothetical protein